jgi:NOL1/NOP2/sun family putative RNA methylase
MVKKNNSSDKLIRKRQAWLTRTTEILSVDMDKAEHLLRVERRQGIRLNSLKPLADSEMPAWLGGQYAWMPDGYALNTSVADIRDDKRIIEGQLFIQNAASWLPVLALDPKPGDIVLDVCAAPGGKTSHIAAITDNQAIIWANDNSRPRLAKLRSNMDRLGVNIAQYTLFDAAQLARRMDGQRFDKILLDAPCSGEGLMNLDNNKDLATWSVAHIKRLQQLQKRILTQAWQLLKPGGTLVYSTCTMAPEEDEAVVDYVLRSHSDAKITPFFVNLPNAVPPLTSWNGKSFRPALGGALRLKPSSDIEAFFVCKLQKL